MLDVSELKVFEFECGETECVIARDYKEACDFYKDYTGEDNLNDYSISEVENWENKTVKCETTIKQKDGTYWENKTMDEIAKEYYPNEYNGAEIISTTVAY